jgi:hypothetical protein
LGEGYNVLSRLTFDGLTVQLVLVYTNELKRLPAFRYLFHNKDHMEIHRLSNV